MISSSSIWALVIRHARAWRRDPNLLLATLYWPFLDILIWGFLGSWIQTSQTAEFKNYTSTALLGILLWQIIGRGSIVIAFLFNEELYSNNIINLFSLPLRTIEWMIGIIVFNAIMMLITSLFCISVIFSIYDVSIPDIIRTFIIFMPPLFLCSIWIGFTCLQILVLLGKRGRELGFVIGWFLLPFSGAYYPVEILPAWAQKFSAYFPMSYLFKGMREYLMHQQDPTPYLIKGYVLSIIYTALALMLFVYCFNQTKQKGLARLLD